MITKNIASSTPASLFTFNFKNQYFRYSALIFFIAFLQYSNTLTHDFAFDDAVVITQNEKVQKGILGIPELLVKHNTNQISDQYGYRPIVLIIFAIEYQLFEKNAKAYHFFNVIYFSLLCSVLFNVLLKLFTNIHIHLVLLVVLLFVVHPIHVEVVANIKSRDEIFSLLFSIISVNYLLKYQQLNQLKFGLFSILFFVLAYFSKESAISFLCILPLCILYKNKWIISKKILLISLIALVLMVSCFYIIYLWRNSEIGANDAIFEGNYHSSNLLGNSYFYTQAVADKLANAFMLLWLYVKNFFYPANLVYYYGYNMIPLAKWTNWEVLLSVLVHVLLLIYSLFKRKEHPHLLFAVLAYLISISFYLQVFFKLADTMADRFFFTPSLFLITTIVFLVHSLLQYSTVKNGVSSKNEYFKKPQKIALAFILLLFSIKTFTRNLAWQNTEVLFETDMEALDNCSQAHYFYGNVLKDKLNNQYNTELEQKMLYHIKRSVEITDSAYFSYMFLANYYFSVGKHKESLDILYKKAKQYPQNGDVNFYLGNILLQKNQIDEAVYYLQKSVTVSPKVTQVYQPLAIALVKQNNFNAALEVIKNLERRTNVSGFVYDTYSAVYFEEAFKYFKKAKNNGITNVDKQLLLGKSDSLMKIMEAFAFKIPAEGNNTLMVYQTLFNRYKQIEDINKMKNILEVAKRNGFNLQ